MKIQGTPSFLRNEGRAVPHGPQAQRKAPETVLSRAAEVFISRRGAQLGQGAPETDDMLTPAEAALAADQKDLDDKRARKAQAAEIEARIHADDTLSDEDKATLQKQADRRKAAGMTDEDRIEKLQKERTVWEKRAASETITEDEQQAASNMVGVYSGAISRLQFSVQEKETHRTRLRTQAVQERADLEAATAKARERADDVVHQQSEGVAAARETLLLYEARRSAAKDQGAAGEEPASGGQRQKSST